MGQSSYTHTPKAASEAGPGVLHIGTGSIQMRCQRLANESWEHTLQKRKLDLTVREGLGRKGWVKGVPRALYFHPPSQDIKRYHLPWINQERATYKLSQNMETRSKRNSYSVGRSSLWGAGSRREGWAWDWAFFIMSLLVHFDFLIMCMYYINKSKN